MFKIVGTFPVKTRLPLVAWALAGLVTLFSIVNALVHVSSPVVMDVYLGGKTGRWLHEVVGTPAVFVTAPSEDKTKERLHEAVPGAPVLSKPVYRETLANAVSLVTH